MKTKLFLTLILTMALSFWLINLTGQTAGEHKLPTDQQVITGTLDNGLRYYVRENKKPENRIEFRLVVNAGSILEDDDQQGLAHFIEHMAFNGTANFSEHDLINFLESSGVDFGADLNAYTSFDETVYMFQIPADREGLIDSAFMILHDWSKNLSLKDEEIDKERGVIHEEWRLGLGANDRMMKKAFPIIFNNSRYADRIPIGKMKVIDSCDYDVPKRFYRDWYRPDLMAVVVVGKIDPAFAEQKIKETFGDLKNPENARPRVEYDIPGNKEPLIAIATDAEATSNMVMLFYKHPKKTTATVNDYKEDIITNLYISMLNARLNEINQTPESPFLYAATMYGGFLGRSIDAYMSFAVTKENQINKALVVLLEENERVKQFGFSQAELERQKAQMISDLEKALEEKDHTPSRVFVSKYVDNFLEKEPYPGIEFEYELTKGMLPSVKLMDVNKLAAQLISDSNLVIMINGPEREGVSIPTEQEVLDDFKKATQSKLEKYKEEAIATSLISHPLPGGEIISETTMDNFGITKLKLNNGVSVLLKPTDFKNDEILMTGFSLGGTSLASDADFMSAKYAAQIMNQSGLGGFSNIDLNKFLTGKNVNVSPSIQELTQELSGNSVKKDLETMFQLTYLYFTEPRSDSTAYLTFMEQMNTQFKFMKANPRAVFYDTLYKLATSNNIRTVVIPTEAQLNSINMEKAYAFYKDRFANANEFQFVFVGNFDLNTIKPLIVKYLGSLPNAGMASAWKDVSPKFPDGTTEATVRKGTEPQSSVAILMDEAFEWNATNEIRMTMLMKILGIRLRENMREDQGGVYGVRASQNTKKYPKEEVSVMIGWGCDPNKADTLSQTVFLEMKAIQESGPSEINLGKAKETLIRDFETNAEQNKYWLGKIQASLFNQSEMLTIKEIQDMISAVSAEDIQNMAKKYFNSEHYLKVVLLPEE
ncbi:MAG: insulinase family protein [Bacteroidetes bacterium CG_4_9_14_3_um_filter_41_19]|nr:MAG: insulinase family protein [Bacteroidetes bacterium CG_4_9_14_3_um_filter_41_19]